MPAPSFASRSSDKAAALIIVLAFVVLVTGLVLAYFSRVTADRQVGQSSYNNTSADLLARSALDIVVGDFRQEIVNGSTATQIGDLNGNFSTIYVPTDELNMVPRRSGDLGQVAPNLIRRSIRSDGISSPGVSSRASAVNSQDNASANGRSISSKRWNEHYLIPKGNPATPDSSPIQAFTLATPDWVIVTRSGPTPFPSWDATLADPSITNPNYAIGRYAYAVYDEGGLLNMNIAGYPIPGTPWPALDPEIGRNKTVPGAFNLTALGTPVGPTAPNPFNQVIGFRNYATAHQATPPATPGTISGTLGSFSWDQNAIGDFIAYILGSPVGSPKPGFGPSGRDFGAVNPVGSPTPGLSYRTDQSFMTRAELINLFKSLNFNCGTDTGICVNTLQYLGTFSLEQNKPTLPLTPASTWPFPRIVLPQRFYLGNLSCVQHPEPPNSPNCPCPDSDKDIQNNFGLQWVNTVTSGSGPCDSQIRWQYVGKLTSGCPSPTPTPATTGTPTPTPTAIPCSSSISSPLDFFQYIHYALFGRTCESLNDTIHLPYTLGIGAALIDQYDVEPGPYPNNTNPLLTGIYYGSNPNPSACDADPGTCLVYGVEYNTDGTVLRHGDPSVQCVSAPAPETRPTSPFDINRPTRSVGEFGWAYSILNAANNRNSSTSPKYLIDFKDPYDANTNPDPALLDFFTYNSAPVRAGIVSLNTRQPLVLAAILKTAYCGFQILTANQAPAAATAIVNATNPSVGGLPAMSRADIPRIASTMARSPCNTTDQDSKDTFARALSETTQTRTWGLLIDVVAQTGHYKPNATGLADFVVEGEKRYWLHVAIDRFDGSIVGQQLEEVTE